MGGIFTCLESAQAVGVGGSFRNVWRVPGSRVAASQAPSPVRQATMPSRQPYNHLNTPEGHVYGWARLHIFGHSQSEQRMVVLDSFDDVASDEKVKEMVLSAKALAVCFHLKKQPARNKEQKTQHPWCIPCAIAFPCFRICFCLHTISK